MSRFIEIPAERLESFLQGCKFTRTVRRSEVVYTIRHHRDPRYVVAVYTSISAGARQARGVGEDAIRVSAFMFTDEANGQTRGIAKCTRVNRTGTVDGVIERLYARMREAYAVCNRRIGGPYGRA